MDLKKKLIDAAVHNRKKRPIWVDALSPEIKAFVFKSVDQYLDGELPQIPDATVFLNAIKQVACEIQEHVQWPSISRFREWLREYKEKRIQNPPAPTKRASRKPKRTSRQRSS